MVWCILTFPYKDYCFVAETLDSSRSSPQVFGQENHFTAVLISSGRCSLEADQPLFAAAGSFLLGSGPLALQPVGPCHLVGITLGGQAAHSLTRSLQLPFSLQGLACPEAAGLFYQILVADEQNHPIQASALAYTLLCEFAQADFTAQPLPELISAAMGEIQAHYAEVYGVEELAAEMGVTKSHLIRCFSASVGITPGQYLTSVRIEHTKRLLLHPELSLESVANLAGFSGANYLCKVFKKETGETPAAWRKANLGTTSRASHYEDEGLFLL